MGEAFEWGTALRELGGWGVASVCMFVIYRMWLYTKELHSAIQKLGLESVKTMAEGNKTLETVGNHVKKNT
jgi:hypothetical protein